MENAELYWARNGGALRKFSACITIQQEKFNYKQIHNATKLCNSSFWSTTIRNLPINTFNYSWTSSWSNLSIHLFWIDKPLYYNNWRTYPSSIAWIDEFIMPRLSISTFLQFGLQNSTISTSTHSRTFVFNLWLTYTTEIDNHAIQLKWVNLWWQ